MPTVRSPSSFAARKMRMAISLRLAASSCWMIFGFAITGSEIQPRETLHFHTSGPRYRRSFFNAESERNLLRGFNLKRGWHGFGANRLGRFGFQLLQLGFDLAPLLRIALDG